MRTRKSSAEISAVVDRFLAAHPEGGVEEVRAWTRLDPELSSDPEFASDFEDTILAVLAVQSAPAHDAATERLPDFGRGSSNIHPLLHVEPGDVLGRFELQERVARGGMGEVWKALDRDLNRVVALKLVLPERVSARSKELFQREARAGGRLSHPNVVSTYDHGEHRGIAWIAQEFVADACTLQDFLLRVAAQQTVPRGHDRAVAELVARIADGLAATHAAGIVHRDLKPSNILLCRGDSPKITDFGLARIEEELALSVSGEVVGTWAYMSPEQVRGTRDSVDSRSDIFSLGVLLYELITRQRPFRGDTGTQIAEQILHHEPLPARSVRPQCPLDLALICHKALEKNASDRYPSAEAFAADLRRFLRHEPVQAKAPSLPKRFAKWVRRHPTTSLSTAVASVSFAIIAWYAVDNARLLDESQVQERIANFRANQARDAAREAKAAELRAAADRTRAEDSLARAEMLLVERDAALAAEIERADELDRVVTFERERLASIDPAAMGVFLRERLIELQGSRPRRPAVAGSDQDFVAQLRGLDFPGLALELLSETLFRDAVTAIESRFGDDPLIQAELLGAVAESMLGVGLRRRALETQNRAVEVLQGEPDVDMPTVLDARAQLARCYQVLGDHAAAAELASAVLAAWRDLGDPDALRSDVAVRIQALARMSLGEVDQALSTLREVRARQVEALGPAHDSTLHTTLDVARALKLLGSFEESEELLREAIAMASADDRLRQTAMSNLALLVRDARRSDEAIPLLEEVLAMSRRDLGDKHPDTLASAQNLAAAYLDEGRLEAAEQLILEVRKSYVETLGPDDPNSWLVANTLGSVLKNQGRLAEAEPLFREALSGMVSVLGEGHRNSLAVKGNLGLVLLSLGRATEAIQLLREVRDGMVAAVGPGHPSTLNASSNLASAHRAVGQLDEAERLLRETVAGTRAVYGEEHRSTLAAMTSLAVVLVERGQEDAAEQLLRQALPLKRRTLGDGHVSTLTTIHALAVLIGKRGRSEEADSLFVESLDGRSAVLGPDHPITVRSIDSYVDYLANSRQLDAARARLRAWLERTQLDPADGRVVKIREKLEALDAMASKSG